MALATSTKPGSTVQRSRVEMLGQSPKLVVRRVEGVSGLPKFVFMCVLA